jgi:serine phosphatase RsbU (regulator of sigma subunit)
MIRVILRALAARKEGSRLIALGFALLFVFTSYDLLVDLGAIPEVAGIRNGYPLGIVGLLGAMSVYLARDLARTNDRILAQEQAARAQETERRLLEADNRRKTRELEEARALQLAMLPRDLPHVPGLALAVYTKTATEVGGDYYDFSVRDDGTLTVALGDATGHGTRAGLMVAIAKSLFRTLAFETDLPRFFNHCTRVLKGMRLGNQYMSLLLLRTDGARLEVSAAGMPPLLLFRREGGQVEEILLKGMPLGAFPDFPYQTATRLLRPGDTLLAMTDGLPEQFDARRELLDLDRVRRAFQEASARTPEEIVERLCEAGESWRQGAAVEDDLTFVVLQVRTREEGT